jgi:hypothetical protein
MPVTGAYSVVSASCCLALASSVPLQQHAWRLRISSGYRRICSRRPEGSPPRISCDFGGLSGPTVFAYAGRSFESSSCARLAREASDHDDGFIRSVGSRPRRARACFKPAGLIDAQMEIGRIEARQDLTLNDVAPKSNITASTRPTSFALLMSRLRQVFR